MGKYDRLLAGLPRLIGHDAKHQEKINAVKAAMLKEIPRQASVFVAYYAAIKAEKEAAEVVTKEINLRLEAISQLMSEQYEVEGTTSMRLAEVGLASIYYEPSHQFIGDTAEQKAYSKNVFRLWCIANGYESQLQLWPSTVDTILKERLEAGEPDPDGLIVGGRRVIRFTKA